VGPGSRPRDRRWGEADPLRSLALSRPRPPPGMAVPLGRVPARLNSAVSDPASPASHAPNIVWSQAALSRDERWRLLSGGTSPRVRGCTVWFTGLSGSGKSTIAAALEASLLNSGRIAYRLDGDNIRHGLNADLGFGEADRHENIRRIGEVARLFADAGVITLVSFISPYRADRERVRAAHSAAGLLFIEVHVDAPLSTCEARDPKGLYRKARAGELKQFTGIDDPYEAPDHPEISLRTEFMGVAQCVSACMAVIDAATN
jgi:adenylyl-sulfate kinase